MTESSRIEHGPPDYLVDKVCQSDPHGPASLLDSRFFKFDLSLDGNNLFEIRWTGHDDEGYNIEPPYIEARGAGQETWFAIYDTRRHPASACRWLNRLNDEDQIKAVILKNEVHHLLTIDPPYPLKPFQSADFQDHYYKVALGFEYDSEPVDNNDVGWFAMAIQSPSTGKKAIIYDDETS